MPKLKSTCTVELLDGSEITVENKHLHHSQEFLHYVCEHIGVAEKDYFGLRYTNIKDGKISWLDVNEPLVRQLRKASRRRFKVGIQFFPDTIDMLQDEVTRYQFVLQTRENLLTGKWSCSMPTQALLASYIIQAEFENYDVAKHGEDYLSDLQFAYCQNADFLEKVALFHKNHRDLSPTDADWLYMKTARKMVMYGMDVYDVVDGDGNVLTLGIDVYGIHILFLNTVLHTFVWVVVSKICCHGKEVLISLKLTSKDQSECITVGFMLTTERDARRVSKACNQNKEFYNLGVVRKTVKKQSKSYECTHVSTRVLPKDFKRVTSLEYTKLFEKEAGELFINGDYEETSNRKDSLEEGSSKDMTTSFTELSHSEQVLQEELGCTSNIEKVLTDGTANIDLRAMESNGHKDEHSDLTSVLAREDDIVVTEVINAIVGSIEGIAICESKADINIPVEWHPLETSEVKNTVNCNKNGISNGNADVYKDATTKDMMNVTTDKLNTVERESSVTECVTEVKDDVDLLMIEKSDLDKLLDEYDVIDNTQLISG